MNRADETEEAIFTAAQLLKDSAKRSAYLDLACDGDPDLRRRMERLLASSSGAEDFFKRSAAVVHVTVPPDATFANPISEAPNSVIGRYKLLEKIGEGGMGVVYMAEQEQPVRRKVALKIIKLGMDTRQVVARFEAERQALALMDHPNIAKVLDAGATESGRPFFVMELVQGVPITRFCDENRLSTEDRLKLFIPVCKAIQSAHQKGIIHRDIKPSNVLVTLNAGVPHPMVIDFGVAKATNQKLTEKTLFTNFATMIGTPAYMSPEQAEMSKLDVDTLSDIYSLGVLLYELLTGTTPFPEKRLRSVAYGEMQRIIVEEEPERPSTRLSKTLAASSASASAKATLCIPHSAIDPDLDWIVMKCLEKDRNRRYDTANGLAADLQRHLSNEPVTAYPPTAAYRFQKFIRRKMAFGAASAVAAALLLGSVVSVWQAVRATRAESEQKRSRQEAQANEAQARAEAAKANAVTKFLKQTLFTADPRSGRGKGTLFRDVLDDSARKLDDGAFRDLPETEASLRSTVGVTYLMLGLVEKARPHLEKSLTLQRQLFGDLDNRVAATMRNLAYLEPKDSARARELLTQALEIQRAIVPPDHGEIAWTLGDFGARERDESTRQARYREALEMYRKAGLEESDHATVVLANLAISVRDSNDPTGAIPLLRRVVDLSRDKSALVEVRAKTLLNLAYTLNMVGQTEEVESLYREGLSIFRKSFEFEHEDMDDCVFRLTEFLTARGEPAKAEAVLLEQYTLLKADPRATPKAEIMVLQRIVAHHKGWHSEHLPKWEMKLESVENQSRLTKEEDKKSDSAAEVAK